VNGSISRRQFLAAAALAPVTTGCLYSLPEKSMTTQPRGLPRLLFMSQGKTAMMNADGSNLRYFDFDVPDQVTWQASGFFSDGRVLFLSMEARRDGPGRPFDQFYHQTPTHLWIYDLERDSLEEIATRERLAVFMTPQLLLDDQRLLMQVLRDGVAQTFSMNLDGTDAQAVTQAGEGMPYGLSCSPDGRRLAFHLASPSGYQVWTSDVDGGNRTLVSAHPDYLYFGPNWSPDGEWLVYQGCLYHQDPGHDWSDLCLGRPDGSQQRLLTSDQALWFGATYGSPETRGGGSNTPVWTQDGAILVSRRLPGSKVPWEYQPQRPDTDHFNRDFRPDLALGGAEICRIDPHGGAAVSLTHSDPPVWDFRQSESPDGRQIVFCRAGTGAAPAIWVADADGQNQRELARGLEQRGADHPRWVPQTD
jgi:Tol biopolymer transport system component